VVKYLLTVMLCYRFQDLSRNWSDLPITTQQFSRKRKRYGSAITTFSCSSMSLQLISALYCVTRTRWWF